MNLPPPTEKQARLWWFSLTALAVGVLAGLLAALLWGLGQAANILTPVLLPLAVAGILAYLLDPVVTFFVKRNVPRLRAILLVFAIVLALGAGLLGTVAPRLVVETGAFIRHVPEYSRTVNQRVTAWIAQAPWAQDLLQKKPGGTDEASPEMLAKVGDVLSAISTWFIAQALRVASWVGLLFGFFLVPVYLFYFLMERETIERTWQIGRAHV